MATYNMSGQLFCEMMRGGAANLRKNIKIVNDLNVFPIPDGDTGDNMCMTAQGGVQTIGTEDTLCDTAKKLSRGMLLSARGNSGVILSQFFEGLSKGLNGVELADVTALGLAFQSGVKQAYSSVMKPTEGTILTVMRESTDYAIANAIEGSSIEDFFEYFKAELKRSLEHTPELLPVLKEAGVIDSGGAGFYYIIEGMDAVLRGEEITFGEDLMLSGVQAAADTSSFTEDSVMEFGYCTELLIQLQNCKVDAENFDENIIISFLETIGDSIVCFKTGTIVKLHVHTMTPGAVIAFCQQYGEFLNIKIENMMIQHNESVVENNFPTAEHKEFAIVSVASGKGICEMFTELGTDCIVDGKQTMNPAAEDFIAAFDSLNADNIIVMPNNSNIILAAKQAAELYDKSNVVVLETKSLAEGYSALTMLDFSSGDLGTIMSELQAAVDGVTTGLVTYAVRDSALDGVEINQGDYLGIVDKHIACSCADKVTAAVSLFDKVDMEEKSIVLAMAGCDVTDNEKQQFSTKMAERFPYVEFYIQDGGQDVYSFILCIE